MESSVLRVGKISGEIFIYMYFGKNKVLKKKVKEKKERLPWWCNGWESVWQCRTHGFDPWSGKIPHNTEQLSPGLHHYCA